MSKQIKLTKKEVEKIADLANIELSKDEIEKYRVQLSSILRYVAKLSELDTSSIKPGASTFNKNILRKDFVTGSLDQASSVSGRKSSVDGYFVIKSQLNNNV